MSWIKYQSVSESLEVIGTIASACAELGGPVSKHLYSLALLKNYQALVDFDIDYGTIDVNDAVYARQILGLFSKNPMIPLDVDRTAVALDRFHKSEAMCLETNNRFRFGCPHKGIVASILHGASRKIANILGPVPSLEAFSFAFGPGANTNVVGGRANFRNKLSAPLTCSSNFASVAEDFLAEVPLWMAHHNVGSEEYDSFFVEITVSAGKLMFVPKNAKTDRSIVVEPLLNSFFQKGVGGYMKNRLLRFNCNLYDQKRNQDLALKGSVSGDLATIDLSMASDCLARNLVADLLPPEWFAVLDGLRTPDVEYKGTRYTLEKFSSMGNGYTFELESLIFYALSLAVCDHLHVKTQDVSVFGDDIIVPTTAYALLADVLRYCGFSVNLEKSFSSGAFRESCGADYLSGFSVRPFYLKTRVSERILFCMHNWFVRHGEYQLAAITHRMTNPTYRLYGPDGYGDGHLLGSFSLTQNRDMRRRGWEGGTFHTYRLKSLKKSEVLPGDWLLPSYCVYTRAGEQDPYDPDIIRGSKGYEKSQIYTFTTSVFRM